MSQALFYVWKWSSEYKPLFSWNLHPGRAGSQSDPPTPNKVCVCVCVCVCVFVLPIFVYLYCQPGIPIDEQVGFITCCNKGAHTP